MPLLEWKHLWADGATGICHAPFGMMSVCEDARFAEFARGSIVVSACLDRQVTSPSCVEDRVRLCRRSSHFSRVTRAVTQSPRLMLMYVETLSAAWVHRLVDAVATR